MYYEERKPRKHRRRRLGCLFRLIVLILIAAVIGTVFSAGYTLLVEDGWLHVLLLGVDYDENGTSRSDTIIIASISPLGDIRLTSIMRDTWVEIPGHGSNKINAAYRFGGPELAMQTVNRAFGTNIRYYMTISLRGLAVLIDDLGGIDMDVTKAEMAEVNSTLAASRRLLAKSGVDTADLTEYGNNVHLTGAQALSFSRIRSIGNDYERTLRQRNVLGAMLNRARACRNPLCLISLIRHTQQYTRTNINWPHTLAQAAIALVHGSQIKQKRLPIDGTFEDGKFNGTWCIMADLDKNRELLYQFLNE